MGDKLGSSEGLKASMYILYVNWYCVVHSDVHSGVHSDQCPRCLHPLLPIHPIFCMKRPCQWPFNCGSLGFGTASDVS